MTDLVRFELQPDGGGPSYAQVWETVVRAIAVAPNVRLVRLWKSHDQFGAAACCSQHDRPRQIWWAELGDG